MIMCTKRKLAKNNNYETRFLDNSVLNHEIKIKIKIKYN